MSIKTALFLLSVSLAMAAAEVPWMARIEELLQPRSRGIVNVSCHSFSTNQVLDRSGEDPLLHLCSFPENNNALCAFTALPPCCRTMAVIEELAQPVNFETIEVDGITYAIQFFNSRNGVCFISEPDVRDYCFNCGDQACIDPASLFCTDGVNMPCDSGDCSCREGYTGTDCCACDRESDFYRSEDTGVCESCGCCSANVVGGSTACEEPSGQCGTCVEGYTGIDCCTRLGGGTEVLTTGTPAGSITTSTCGVPCIIGIVVGIILAILLFLLLLLLIYGLYRYKNTPKTKLEETGAGLGGDARDNPLYLEPATVVEETQ